MEAIARPTLVDVDILPFEQQGKRYLRLSSREGLSDECLMVPMELAEILRLFDGSQSRLEIERQVQRRYNGSLPVGFLDDLLAKLSSIYVLDTPDYRTRRAAVIEEYCRSDIRPASHAGGAYEGDPHRLRLQIREMFTSHRGPGHPEGLKHDDLSGIFSPHIDFRRGGSSFAWGFKELAERTTATTFVIVATSHYSMERFVLSRKDYETPFGIARTNQAFVDQIAKRFGPGCFKDEYASRHEHSIEFQVLFLQYLFEGKRDFRIVPLLVGSFHDAIQSRSEPAQVSDIGRMIAALREATELSPEKVCFICSGDLAHIGMKFGDPWMVDSEKSAWCRARDHSLLNEMESAAPDRLFQRMAQDQDERRICGFPPAYLMFHAMQKSEGKRLCYDQFVDPRGHEIVSFASMAFYDRG